MLRTGTPSPGDARVTIALSYLRKLPLYSSSYLLLITLFAGFLSGYAQSKTVSAAVAWGVRGSWTTAANAGKLGTGDLVAAGSLLHAGTEGGEHAIVLLFPGGQRVFYECYAAWDCARGFRVPRLGTTPGAFAVTVMKRIHEGFMKSAAEDGTRAARWATVRKDEAAVVLGKTGE